VQYLKPTFTLPAAPANVSQKEWDRIFSGVDMAEKEDIGIDGWKSDGSGFNDDQK
jgi:hypothetical protein